MNVRRHSRTLAQSTAASLGAVTAVPLAVEALAARLAELGWVSDLLVAGSLATGDHIAGVSDFDLVAITEGAVDQGREAALVDVHKVLDCSSSVGVPLGCVYVAEGRLSDRRFRHPTWTHGRLVHRMLSDLTRAELVRYGFAVYGRAPASLLPAMTDDQVRRAARVELCGYWRASIDQVRAPDWLVDQLRARRRGGQVISPRLRTAWIAWRDARNSVRRTCRG